MIQCANCNCTSSAKLCQVQNCTVCIIMQSTKLGRVLNKNLVKLLIWDEMGCGIEFLVFWIQWLYIRNEKSYERSAGGKITKFLRAEGPLARISSTIYIGTGCKLMTRSWYESTNKLDPNWTKGPRKLQNSKFIKGLMALKRKEML